MTATMTDQVRDDTHAKTVGVVAPSAGDAHMTFATHAENGAPAPSASTTDHGRCDTHSPRVGVEAPFVTALDQRQSDTQVRRVDAVTPSPATGQSSVDARGDLAGAGISSTTTGQSRFDTQSTCVGVVEPSPPTGPNEQAEPVYDPVQWAAFDQLRVYAECLADAMEHRKAVANRLRSGTVDEAISIGLLENLENTEKLLRKGLRGSLRKAAPEIVAWIKSDAAKGIGEETVARLIGVIGHPLIARPHHWEGEGDNRRLVADPEYKRTVSQLWSYCGHGDAARRKGMSVEEAFGLGSPRAKTLVYLCAESAVKAGLRKLEGADATFTPDSREAVSEYGQVYLDRRIHTWDRDDWTPGHKHADALRIVGKRILRDLWIAAHGDETPPVPAGQ